MLHESHNREGDCFVAVFGHIKRNIRQAAAKSLSETLMFSRQEDGLIDCIISDKLLPETLICNPQKDGFRDK